MSDRPSDIVWRRDEIESPCVKICVVHPEARICTGCLRTIDEITSWGRMSREERRAVMAELPARKAQLQVRRGGRAYPYMEHFANENDLVARLGVLSPNDKIEIDGQRFVRRGAWGHLLNEHHLYPIDDYLYPRDAASETTDPYPPLYRSSRATPRLYRYFHGKRPRALAR